MTRSSQGARTLRGAYYTWQEMYDRETERIFRRRWLCVGLAAELPEPGSFLVVPIEGESLLIVRDRDGEIRAFHNVCRHRGTRLCAEPSGAVGKYVVCPYHAWAYELSGGLAAAPNMDEVEGFDPADYPLHPVATHVWDGLVFVNLDRAATPFAEALPGLVTNLADWNLRDLVPVHKTEYEVEANWKLLCQNYSECYHCPSLHPVLNRLTPYRGASNDLEEGPVLGGPMLLADDAQSMTMDGRACATPLPSVASSDTADAVRLVHYYVVFPTLFLSLMPDYALVHRVTRRGPSASTVACQWLFHPSAVSAADFDPSGAVDFWDMTNRQDWRVCELSQAGIASSVYEPGPYANLESMLAALDREYLAAMEA